MHHYIAIIHKDKDSDFGVSFPDLPGCISAGKTLEEARLMAIEALETHITYMIEEGLTVPETSSLDAVASHEDYEGAAAVLLVPFEMEQKIQRVNISVPERDLMRIDRYTSARGLNRSSFLVRSALEAIQVSESIQEHLVGQHSENMKVYQTNLGPSTEINGWDTRFGSLVVGAVQ
jgi:predicted RNase H-like HicB family nuclease